MNITRADYSNLQNSIANRINANSQIISSITNGINQALGSVNTIANTISSVKAKQDQADQATLAPLVEGAMTEAQDRLNASIAAGNTKMGADGNVVFGQDWLDYMATWKDQFSEGEYSDDTRKWIDDNLDGFEQKLKNASWGAVNTMNETLISKRRSDALQEALVEASQAEDFSIYEKAVKELGLSDYQTELYLLSGKSDYETSVYSMKVDEIASNEGLGAAYKYIDGLKINIEEKDTLKNRANGTSKQTDAVIQDTAKKTVSNMLAQGESWGSIYKQSDNLGLSPYQKKLWDDQVSALQSEYVTDIVAPYLAKLSTSTPDEISEMKTLLEQNKHMFVNMEGTYETYMAKLDSTYTASTKVSSTELKNGMNSWYYKWESGEVSAYDAMEGIRSLAINSDSDVVAEMDKLFSKMKNKVPSYAKDTFDQEMKFFTNYILGEEDVSSIKNLNPEAYEEYTKNYAWLYSSMMDWINANPNCTMTQLSEQFAKTRNTFTAKYLSTKGLLTDTFSFVDLINENLPNEKDIAAFGEAIAEFEDSVPFIYENGKFEWYSSSAQEEFYKMEDYGLQLLNAYGYDVKYANILQVGDNAYPVIVYSNDEGQKLIVERDGTVRGISTEGGILSMLGPVAPGSSNSETNGEATGEGSTNLNTIAGTKARKLISPASPEEIKAAQQKADKVADENLGVMDESVMDNMAEDANAVLANKEAKTDKKIAKAMENMESDIRLTLDMEGDSGSYTDEAIAPYMDEILAYAEKLMKDGKSRYEAVTKATRELKNRVNKGNR